MNDDNSARGEDTEHSRYRVLSHHGPSMMVSVQLRPEGWKGADLYLCETQTVAVQRYAVGSIQVITRAQRQTWRDAGVLIGSSNERLAWESARDG